MVNGTVPVVAGGNVVNADAERAAYLRYRRMQILGVLGLMFLGFISLLCAYTTSVQRMVLPFTIVGIVALLLGGLVLLLRRL